MSELDDDVAAALVPLLRRLYARFRARGQPPESACDSAASVAAELLACEVAVARRVMADLPISGPQRPL